MVSINWCKKQSRGITLIEPNENLCREYLNSAEETLVILKDIEGKSNMWLATAKQYCEYFAVCSLLMKLGIKSEIHDCTISLCSMLEKDNLLPEGTHNLLEKDKKLRIDNQYYLKNTEVKIDFPELAQFILQIKQITNLLTSDTIKSIREKIEKE